jgi:hypothetical protein
MGSDREATDEEFDDDALLEELSNLLREKCGHHAKE